jgi:hypothetical protein
MSEVKVGQVWRCEGGAELRVTQVTATGIAVAFTRRDGSIASAFAREMTPANGWTLVADAPEAQAKGIDRLAQVVAKTSQVEACATCYGKREIVHFAYKRTLPCPACTDARPLEALQECSALRGTLPVSEQFVESPVHANDAAGDAVDELQRKAGTLRSWPACPVSKQELVIEASVLADVRARELKEGAHPRLPAWHHETLQTWQARFECPTCRGGGR